MRENLAPCETEEDRAARWWRIAVEQYELTITTLERMAKGSCAYGTNLCAGYPAPCPSCNARTLLGTLGYEEAVERMERGEPHS